MVELADTIGLEPVTLDECESSNLSIRISQGMYWRAKQAVNLWPKGFRGSNPLPGIFIFQQKKYVIVSDKKFVIIIL
jgi:hypothetical protein